MAAARLLQLPAGAVGAIASGRRMPLDDPNLRDAIDGPELPRMSFGDHLDELRSRLVKALLAVVVAVLAVMPWKEQVQGIIINPYRVQWRAGFVDYVASLEAKAAAAKAANVALDADSARFLEYCRQNQDAILAGTKEYSHLFPVQTGYHVPYSLYAMGGIEDIMSFMWASILFALVLASPVVVWQAWAFVAAGLYPQERAIFYRYFPFMVALLAAGVAFGYFVVLPYTLGFLVQWMNPDQVGAMFSVGQFLSLEFALTGAMGLVFQLPLVMVALQKIGLVTHGGFRKHWRMTILCIFVFAAVLTPPEPVSMLLMSFPMVLLYGLGLLLTWFSRGKDAAVAPA